MSMEPGRDTTTDASTHDREAAQVADRSRRAGRTLAWVIGAIVLGVIVATAGVILVAAVLVRAGDPAELGPSLAPTGGPLALAERCRSDQPVSMQIDFAAPAPTIEAAESTAKSQVGEAYAISTWHQIETGPDGSAWYGVTADASVGAVFEVEGAGTSWMIGDIRRC